MQLPDWVKNLLITAIFIIVFLWYVFPLTKIYGFYFLTKHFQSRSHVESIESLSKSLFKNKLQLDHLSAYISSIITSAGLTLLLFKKNEYKLSAILCAIFLFLFVIFFAWAAHYMFYKLIELEAEFNQEYGVVDPESNVGAGTVLIDFCASRFKGIIAFLFIMLGLSSGLGYAQSNR